jgi:hypothetical protein
VKPIHLPPVEDFKPGAVFHSRGSRIRLLDGKHPDDELYVEALYERTEPKRLREPA